MNKQENKLNELFRAPKLTIINIGVSAFAEAVERQHNAKVVQVNWRPLAGGDKNMQDFLKILGV